MHPQKKLFAGTSGLVVPPKRDYPKHFQDKSRLCYYASLFNSIEINSSFYKTPMASTVKKWAADVPDNFQFTFKLLRDLSHNKGLLYDSENIQRFFDVINGAGDKKGCLLVQFPPSITVDFLRPFEQLLSGICEENNGLWKIAIEFRNRSWYQDDIYDLLNTHNTALVLHDLPSSSTPLLDQQTDFVYLRFHGPNRGYRGSYTDDFLSEYSYYVKDWIVEGKTVYAYFNNTMGDASKNLRLLLDYVDARFNE